MKVARSTFSASFFDQLAKERHDPETITTSFALTSGLTFKSATFPGATCLSTTVLSGA